MASQPISKRLQYLNDLAHSISQISPSTSAHLMSEYTKLAYDNNIALSDARKRSVCSSCGNIMVPENSCATYTEESVPKSRKKSNGSPESNPRNVGEETVKMFKVFECKTCNNKTRQLVSAQPKLASHLAANLTSKES